MARPSAHTYQRLLKKLIVEMSRIQPGADEKLVAKLNKKFAKYKRKLETFK